MPPVSWVDLSRRRLLLAAGALALPFSFARAQEEPSTGGGNFSLFVPTPDAAVTRMLEIAEVKAGDYVIDLGSGDGRIVIAAARKYGARGLGVDIDAELVEKSRAAAAAAGVAGRVKFEAMDVMAADLRGATVVTMYLFPELLTQLRPKLMRELAPGTRIVVHDFAFGGWEPDGTESFFVPEKYFDRGGQSRVSLWIVPADVAGRWRISLGGGTAAVPVRLQQTHQMLEVLPERAGSRTTRGRLRGEQIEFALALPGQGTSRRHEFTGRVNGETMAGVARRADGATVSWSASRVH
jgi:SAM-dependent methyltransferase